MRGYGLLAMLTFTGLITLPFCAVKACPWMTFGPDCQYQCHCAPNFCCDKIDGSCSPHQRCAGGWFGPGCQFRDFAYDQKTYPINSSQRAIRDGKENSCNVFFHSDHTTIYFDPPINFAWMRLVNYYGGTNEVKLTATAGSEVLEPKRKIHPVTSFNEALKHWWVSDYYGDFGKEIDSLTLNFGKKGAQACSINVANRRPTVQQVTEGAHQMSDTSKYIILVGIVVAGVMGIAVLFIMSIYFKKESSSTGKPNDVQDRQERVETPEAAEPGGAEQRQSLNEGRIETSLTLNQGGITETVV